MHVDDNIRYSAMLTIQGNIFQRNSLHALYHTYENITTRPKLIIQQNSFLDNAKPPTEYRYTRSGLILINVRNTHTRSECLST